MSTSPYPPVPVANTVLQETLLSAIQRHAKHNPERKALINAENLSDSVTYEQLLDKIQCVSSFLRKHGVAYRDVVCQVLPNSIEYIVGYIATISCGATLSGASAMFTDYELEKQFQDSCCKAVITDGNHLDRVMRAASNCRTVKLVLCIRPLSSSLPAKVYSWDDALNCKKSAIPPVPKRVDDVVLLPYSSGTTGSPKGVMLTHKNFGTMMEIFAQHFEIGAIPQFERGDRWDWRSQHMLLVLPFYHIYGLGVMTMTLQRGATGVVMSKFDPTIFLSSIEHFKIEILLVVPPIVLMMVRHPLAQKFDLSSVQLVLTGAAPLGKELCDEFFAKYSKIRFLVQGYGMTECSMASHLPAYSSKGNYVTVGPVVANVEQKIVDPTSGKDLPRGQRGELCVRGPTVMKGYLNKPEATAETIDEDGWLLTGDVAYINENEECFIVDRIKELIKVKGLQVPPAELEDLLHGHPGVADVAVIGIPNPNVGELPKAFIVKADPNLTSEAILKYVEGKVSSYKWLTGGVEFVKEIPKSPSGKILRRLLRQVQSKL